MSDLADCLDIDEWKQRIMDIRMRLLRPEQLAHWERLELEADLWAIRNSGSISAMGLGRSAIMNDHEKTKRFEADVELTRQSERGRRFTEKEVSARLISARKGRSR